MRKSIVIKIVFSVLLLAMFASQVVVLYSPISAFLTQLPPDGLMCKGYALGVERKYLRVIDIARIVGVFSLAVMLVLFGFIALSGKQRRLIKMSRD